MWFFSKNKVKSKKGHRYFGEAESSNSVTILPVSKSPSILTCIFHSQASLLWAPWLFHFLSKQHFALKIKYAGHHLPDYDSYASRGQQAHPLLFPGSLYQSLQQGSQTAPRAKWGLKTQPEGRIMTLMQQWRYLNITGNSVYILFPAKGIRVTGKSFLAVSTFV